MEIWNYPYENGNMMETCSISDGAKFHKLSSHLWRIPSEMTRDDRNLQATKAYRHRRCYNLGSENRDIMGLGQVETTIH